MHTVWHQLLRSTTTGTDFREARTRLWCLFKESTGLERKAIALSKVEITDFPKLACGLLSHIDQLMVPPVNQEIISQSVESVYEFIRRSNKESTPRIQNNFTIYLLTRTSHHISVYLTRCAQFLHETALLFEPCVHHALVMIKVLWSFIEDVMITSYGLDARLLLAQTSGLAEAFLRMSIRDDLDLDPVRVIDVFGPSARWRKVLCSDHSLLQCIISITDETLGEHHNDAVHRSRNGGGGGGLGSKTKLSTMSTTNSAPPCTTSVVRLQTSVGSAIQRRVVDDAPPTIANRKLLKNNGPDKLLLSGCSSSNQSAASPASLVVSGSNILARTSYSSFGKNQVIRDICMLQVIFLLIGCCEELSLKSSLGTEFSQRLLRLSHRLFVQTPKTAIDEYNHLWKNQNHRRASTAADEEHHPHPAPGDEDATILDEGIRLIGGLGLVLLFNMGCTKSGSQFLYNNGVMVLEIINEIHARFSPGTSLNPLIGGLMECIVAGTPTDIHMLTQLNPKRIKHYNQIMKCGCCGHMAVGSRKLKICGECHLTRYCGRSCQQEDWKQYHSKTCKSQINQQ